MSIGTWVDIATQLISCASFQWSQLSATVSASCIEEKIVPVIAQEYINTLSSVEISGTNPAPRNRSWGAANKNAIILIVIMAIVTVAVVVLVVVCVVCERNARKSRQAKSSDEEMSSTQSGNPLNRGVVARGGSENVSRGSSRYSSNHEKASVDDSVGPAYGSDSNPPTTYGVVAATEAKVGSNKERDEFATTKQPPEQYPQQSWQKQQQRQPQQYPQQQWQQQQQPQQYPQQQWQQQQQQQQYPQQNWQQQQQQQWKQPQQPQQPQKQQKQQQHQEPAKHSGPPATAKHAPVDDDISVYSMVEY